MRERIYFEEFYDGILYSEIKSWRSNLHLKKRLVAESVAADYERHLKNQLQKICLRTLIQQMQIYKNRGMLKGKNEEEEYHFFCEHMVGQEHFRTELYEDYPVLKECIENQIAFGRTFYKEILTNYEKDREDISCLFRDIQAAAQIVKIERGLGDTHQKGKQVVKIYLDKGATLIYKPRTMANELFYHELLNEIAQETGTEQYQYSILSCSDHSWCECVEQEACEKAYEIKDYYKRMGAQLFAAYLLGTKDLHCENLIAHGAYPVIVDLEVFIHNLNMTDAATPAQQLEQNIQESVLTSGMLPNYMWNHEGNGVDLSGIGGKAGQVYPFKVPTVIHPETSNMYIGYEYPVTKESKNLPTINGQPVDPLRYSNEIREGFCMAYKAVFHQKEKYRTFLNQMHQIQNRVLLMNTQQYSMILSLSYHPDFLKKEGQRRALFDSIKSLNRTEKEIIHFSEKTSLLRGDIPYFYVKGDERMLCSDTGTTESDYFYQTAAERVSERLDKLHAFDLDRQSQYIKLSIEMSGTNKENCKNKVYSCYEAVGDMQNGEHIEEPRKVLADRLLNSALWNQQKTEVNWEVIGFNQAHIATWQIDTMNMYLYSGLAGMLLVTYKLQKIDERQAVRKIFAALKTQIFTYTKKGMDSYENLCSQNTGMYDGEGSIVYTYLLLYEWSKEKIYLEYAVNHAEILLSLLKKDEQYDLLNGNAGAAKVLLRLYEVTLNPKYLQGAEESIRELMKSSEQMGAGIGWRAVKELPPMSGMAHGNSGVLPSVFLLWKLTKKEIYLDWAKQILEYEDSLYDKVMENWTDVRCDAMASDIIGNVAWCHGAAGILQSRVECYSVCKDMLTLDMRAQLEKDIERAFRKLEQFWRRDSYTLCHGVCGNLWILEQSAKVLGREVHSQKQIDLMKEKMIQEIYLLPQEQNNPSFMNGYGGILYWMMCEED